MQLKKIFEYGIIRYVPRVERQEFINVGILFSCHAERLLCSRYDLNRERLQTFFESADLDLLETHLGCMQAVCQGQGPLGGLPLRERFHWLAAPRSTIIQVSPVHSGFCQDLEQALEDLLEKMVR